MIAHVSARSKIEVQNSQRRRCVNVQELQRFAERALQLVLRVPSVASSGLQNLASLRVILVSDRRMAALHRKFMNMQGATDVITFQHGEIFVSVETAQRNAARFCTSTKNELKLYLVHGLLHLHGFDDKSFPDASLMEAAQKRILLACIS